MNKNKSLIRSNFGFFLSGFFVLSIGAIMPDLRVHLNLNYTSVGTILSMFAFGNLLSNFLFPVATKVLGNRKATTSVVFTIPLGFILMFFLKSNIKKFLWILFLIMGIGRGSISIVSNTLTNDLSENKTKAMNLLHTIWALGAFTSSFVIIGLKKLGLSFDGIMIFMVLITVIMWYLYASIDYNYEILTKEKRVTSNKKLDFYFYSVALLMFFYLGVENTINGWFMTYLQDMKIINESIAAFIVSFTWLMIMIGRIFSAYISEKIEGQKIVLFYSIGVALMVLGLLTSNNPKIITITILVLGFFLSGIYPTSLSNASAYVTGSQKRLALLLTSAAIGGMLTPQLIGIIADRVHIGFAINILGINVMAMVILAFISYVISKE